MPDGFPPLTLGIMRSLCALTVLHGGMEGQEKLIKCLDALYHAYWVGHKPTIQKEVLAEILSGVLGAEEAKKGWFIDVPFALSLPPLLFGGQDVYAGRDEANEKQSWRWRAPKERRCWQRTLTRLWQMALLGCRGLCVSMGRERKRDFGAWIILGRFVVF